MKNDLLSVRVGCQVRSTIRPSGFEEAPSGNRWKARLKWRQWILSPGEQDSSARKRCQKVETTGREGKPSRARARWFIRKQTQLLIGSFQICVISSSIWGSLRNKAFRDGQEGWSPVLWDLFSPEVPEWLWCSAAGNPHPVCPTGSWGCLGTMAWDST